MGKFTINGTAKQRGADKIDQRLVKIMEYAAAHSPYDVELFSGKRNGGGKSQHDHGSAIDLVLRDPETGAEIPNLGGGGAAFEAYERFAQQARQIQQQEFPELGGNFRWGGYFGPSSKNPTGFDSMHFDIKPGGGMRYGSWEEGLHNRSGGLDAFNKLGAGQTYSSQGQVAGILPTQMLAELQAPIPPNRENGQDDVALHAATQTLLGEAAGEGREGMVAVANVFDNRVDSSRYPSNLLDVVKQKNKKGVSQFSTWNEGKSGNNPDERFPRGSKAYNEARAIVADVSAGRIPDPVRGGTSYYAPKGMKGGKEPYWWDEESKDGSVRIANQRFALGPEDITPSTALAAIEDVAPMVPTRPESLAYAPVDQKKPRRASIFDMASAANNAKWLREGKPNKFSSAGAGVQKVADLLGNAILDTGQTVMDAGQNTVSSMIDVLDTPQQKEQREVRKATAADLWRLGVVCV